MGDVAVNRACAHLQLCGQPVCGADPKGAHLIDQSEKAFGAAHHDDLRWMGRATIRQSRPKEEQKLATKMAGRQARP
jgi:hypothetical protein